MKIGTCVFRFRWLILAAWLVVAGLAFAVPRSDPAATDRPTLLPDYTPYVRAVKAMVEAFPGNSSLSEAVVIFERPAEALTAQDYAFIEHVAGRISRPDTGQISGQDLAGVRVRSPGSYAALKLPLTSARAVRNPMVSDASDRGQAALVRVNVPHSYLAVRSYRIVNHIRAILAGGKCPPGLAAAVSGSCGFGHDYAQAADRSFERSSYVTLSAIIIILLLVYRAPLAAMIPLGSISLAAVVVLGLLGVGQVLHMHVGTAERIFVFVLLYGAGTDYSLLLISRYREFLKDGSSPPAAAAGSLTASFPTILASAGTNAVGLFMMTFADFSVFQTTGPAVAMAMVMALLASVTLVPALVGIIGPRQFWPASRPGRLSQPPSAARTDSRGFWAALARVVTLRPALVLVVTLGVLAIPAWKAAGITWVYDTLAGMNASYESGVGNAAAGVDIAKRHWPIGEIAPVTVLVRADRPLSGGQWEELCRRLAGQVEKVPGVSDVRSLDRPLGAVGQAGESASRQEGTKTPPTGESVLRRLWWPFPEISRLLETRVARKLATAEYVSEDRRVMRLSAALGSPPFSLEAMDAVRGVGKAAEKAVAESGVRAEVLIAGATAEMRDVRTVTEHDTYRIAGLTLGAIFVIVLILLRDVILTAFMVAATVVSYLAALGLTYWYFAQVTGAPGLDWKVEVLLFVVMVAVGVDYSIFLAGRMKQEAAKLPMVQATQQAIIHTGPVISSCGLIMAATLGSIMAGDLKLLRQLGFAFVLGMLIDTFVIRPLVLPAFAVLVRRRTGAVGPPKAPSPTP